MSDRFGDPLPVSWLSRKYSLVYYGRFDEKQAVSWCLETLEVRLNEIILLNLDIRLNRQDCLFRGAGQGQCLGGDHC